MDTWFSSWIWPISVFNGFNDENDSKDLDYYYPTNDIVTAPEIMFFWVARMIISGFEFKGEIPFKNVYYTGIVRDKLGRKMSKSLGNSPDPIELMKKFGADGVRVGMLLSSPAGNDLLFDSGLCEQGRNFTNKIWNAFRLVNSWEVKDITQPESSALATCWFSSKFNATLKELNTSYDKFRMSEALMTSYKLIWDDFCSWYLEMIKPAYGQPIDAKTKLEAISFFENILKVIHPFTPFIAEEIWHLIGDREQEDCIINAKWPTIGDIDDPLLLSFNLFENVIIDIRTLRKDNNIANKVKLEMIIKENKSIDKVYDSLIIKLGNLSKLEYSSAKIKNAFSFIIASNEYFVPFNSDVDIDKELDKIKKEIDAKKGFLNGVLKKLNNPRFVDNAPEKVVELENKKREDAENQIKVLEEKLTSMAK